MPVWRPECPLCGSRLDIAKLKYGLPFPCPFCKNSLHISGKYFWLPVLTGFLLAAWLGYMLGFKFPKIMIFPALFGFPISTLVMLILTRTSPPKIEEHYPDYFDLKHRF